MKSEPLGSGMGTSGLVGQIGTLDAMGYTTYTFMAIALLHFILPILMVFGLDVLFRRKNWILKNDLALEIKTK
jgi:uncharacterized membrane protein